MVVYRGKQVPAHSPIRTVSAQPATAESQSTGGETERTGRTSRVRFASTTVH